MVLYKGALFVFLFLAVTLSRGNPITIRAGPLENEEYRLKNTVKPVHYDLSLIVSDDFEKSPEFFGRVKIHIQVISDTTPTKQEIIIHKNNLNIEMAALYEEGKETENLLDGIPQIKPDAVQMVGFKVAKDLSAGKKYILNIQYNGKLQDNMYGFYRSSYKDESGKTEWLATTQFQPTHARTAFPCFDEPNLKAKFVIRITHPETYHALSNTEGTRAVTIPNDGTVTTTFAETPTMSTYLVAFIVSKFASMSINVDKIGTNRVWSQKELIGTGTYSFNIAPKLLEQMEKFTTIPYSASTLTKLDQAAIPDFSAGAMENWGLVTYRETALLWDPAESTARSKQRVATVVAHELAHMWFGNLITVDWWDSTWLNEGFARYYEYHATAKVETEWELEKQFVVEQQQAILNTDAVKGAKPLTSTNINTPDEISGKFDSITYSKGGSIIRMMQHFLGTDYDKGIEKYFDKQRHFLNTVPDNLWDALQPTAAGSPNLKVVMESWTKQSGFPVVTVTRSEKKNIKLAQKRFLFTADAQDASIWHIPISYTTSAEKDFSVTTPKQWLTEKEKTFNGAMTETATWIILNIQDSAYYRVNYDDGLWEGLQAALQKTDFDKIDPLNRAKIVDDAMNLARAGINTYDKALTTIEYLEKEEDYYPWYSAFSAFSYLRRRIDNNSELGRYLSTHILHLMQNLYGKTPFEGGSKKQIDIHKKVLALTWACQLDEENCVKNSQDSFNLLKTKEVSVEPDLRSIVYCTALRNSKDIDDWSYLWTRYTKTTLASEATTIISALGCTQVKKLLDDYLAKTIVANSGIRSQDTVSVFTAVVSGSSVGIDVGLDFLINNFEAIQIHYGGMNPLTSVISALGDRLATKEQVNKFAQFVDANQSKLGEAAAAANIAKANSNTNLEWVNDKGPLILEYLKNKHTTDPVTKSTTTYEPTTTNEPTTAEPGGVGTITASSVILLFSIILTAVYK